MITVTRLAMFDLVQRYAVAFGSLGKSDVVADEWYRHLGHFPADVLHAALDELVRTADSHYRPRLATLRQIASRLTAERCGPVATPDPRGQPGTDFCRQCGTPFAERLVVRADRTSYGQLLCECQYRATLMQRADAALDLMGLDDPFVADELRRRATVTPDPSLGAVQRLTARIGHLPVRLVADDEGEGAA
jgi:hypothetical protein